MFAGVSDRINMTELNTVAGGASKVLSAENFNQVPLYTEYLIDIATTGASLLFSETASGNLMGERVCVRASVRSCVRTCVSACVRVCVCV